MIKMSLTLGLILYKVPRILVYQIKSYFLSDLVCLNREMFCENHEKTCHQAKVASENLSHFTTFEMCLQVPVSLKRFLFCSRDHSFNTYAKLPEKLTLLTP